MTRTPSVTTLLILLISYLIALGNTHAHAQIWSCSEGYTNHPEGKTNCHGAGAATSCSKSGDRYFAPRRAGESLNPGDGCGRGGGPISKIFGSDTFDKMSASKDGLYNQFSKSLSSAKGYFKGSHEGSSNKKKIRIGDPQYQDIFSCFTGGGGFSECSIAELSSFVEDTFMQASEALR